MLKFETKRLVIRDHLLNDLYDYHELISNEEAMKYLLDIKTSSLEESKNSLQYAITQSNLGISRKDYFWGIFDKLEKYIGEISYSVNSSMHNKNKIVHLGYFIKKEYWNMGLTSEAMEKILDFAFHENDVIKIETGCLVENKYSEKIMKKFKFSKESYKPKHQWIESRLLDRVEYGLLREQFLT